MTNEKLIKMLNTEELAGWIVGKITCKCCPLLLVGYCHRPNNRVRIYCRENWKRWLQSEEKE